MAHGMELDFKEIKLEPPKPLAGLTEEQKILHDRQLEDAKRRVLERARKRNGNNSL